jgi:peptide/nickel transport system permease protein
MTAESTKRRRALRIGGGFILLLVVLAALAPFIASSSPLFMRSATETSWPRFSALTKEDVLWAGFLIASIVGWGVRRYRVAAVALVVILTGFLASDREPTNLAVLDFPQAERDGAWMVWAPLRHGADDQDRDHVLADAGTASHPLGTDALGRDVAARLLFGARMSLLVGLLAAGTATVLGLLIGALSGWYRGWVDAVTSLVIQVFMCFPALVLILAAVTFLRPSMLWVMLLIGFLRWTGPARLVRGEVLRLREMPYVEGARALGVPDLVILFRHVVPHALPPVIVSATLGVAGAILLESTLSFLGVGESSAPSWGRMLRDGRDVLPRGSHLIVGPGLLIFLTVCAWNLIGEALRVRDDGQREAAP